MKCVLNTYVKQKKQKTKKMKNEVTFAMILPSCMNYASWVEEQIANTNLRIKASAVVQFTAEQSEELCAKWRKDASFASRVQMLSSGKVKVYLLSGKDAIKHWNDLIGPEDPGAAEASWHQLRCKFADAKAYADGNPDNGFYGSTNREDAEKEIDLMKKWKIFSTG